MAARINFGTKAHGWSEAVRQKIKTSMLVNRLTDHAEGKIELAPTQVKAIEILLRKTLADLTYLEHGGTVQHEHNVITDTPRELMPDDWAERHSKLNGHSVN